MTGLSIVFGHDRPRHQTYIQANDRLGGREVPLPHDLLAIMLGVHRPAVSVALKALERRGLVRPGRGNITILNRKGLERYSKGAYVAPNPL